MVDFLEKLSLLVLRFVGYLHTLNHHLMSSLPEIPQLYCHWATMTRAEDDLIVRPLIRLPSEKQVGYSESDVESEKERIRKRILSVSNEKLLDDPESMEFLSTLGGDLMINAFACNFKVNGKVNDDVVSACICCSSW